MLPCLRARAWWRPPRGRSRVTPRRPSSTASPSLTSSSPLSSPPPPPPPLPPLVAANAAMSCFHTRQAKRLLPLVAAAGTVGSMVVGALAQGLATRLGTGSLLYLAAAMCLLSLPLPRVLAERA